MQIRFLNHSSYILEAGPVRLLVDPWFDGKVFQDAWGLISSTPFRDEEFSSITHIWMSHEHPDHFHPPTLKRIPESDRKRIVLLFPQTLDGRVVNFLKANGFSKIIEMTAQKELELATGVHARCNLFGEIDSWIHVRAEGKGILNTNDCGIRTESAARAIRDRIEGPVDLLLTQFSYAYWKGNPDQKSLREEDAFRKLGYLAMQANVFQPRELVPIASFIWFCHEENFYLNDSLNTPRSTCSFIEKNTGARPVILFPGETHEPGVAHDNERSLRLYEESYSRTIRPENCVKTKSVDKARLFESANKFLGRLKERSPWWFHRAIPATKIHISDWNECYELTMKGFAPISLISAEADVSLTSESLDHCFRFPYGIDTLGINGRYRRPPKGHFEKFYRFFRFELLSERGISVGLVYVLGAIYRKFLARLGLFTP